MNNKRHTEEAFLAQISVLGDPGICWLLPNNEAVQYIFLVLHFHKVEELARDTCNKE